MDIQSYMVGIGRQARAASRQMAAAETACKNAALAAIAAAIREESGRLSAANALDLCAAQARQLEPAAIDRLSLSEHTIEAMAAGVEAVAALPDPVGEISALNYRPSGIQVGRMRVPLGVIGIIYESRPNVTADAAALCIKSGNAAILRGGSEAVHSNQAIAACIQRGLREAGLPEQAVQVLEVTDRAAVGELVSLQEYVDVIVPRGGKGLIERLMRESRIPMIKHLHGVCHVYVDDRADPQKAIRIADNAKTQRYGTCNTMETLLVHRAIAAQVLPPLARIYLDKGVELRGDTEARALVPEMQAATEEDWYSEYLAPILAVRIVDGIDQAIAHIREYGSGHTEAIVAEDAAAVAQFFNELDSAILMHNASTQFADGGEFGMGAEIGIATGRIHARGPVGAAELTSYKYLVRGSGQTRPA